MSGINLTPCPLSIAMERGNDLKRATIFGECHSISRESPLSIAMERGRG
jgi:hypothetical protein